MSSSYTFDWYGRINEENLEQGDFFFPCHVIIPTAHPTEEEAPVKVVKYNVIIMSQSCDLENKKLNLVLVCPFWPLGEFKKMNSYFNSERGFTDLKRGNSSGYHLLNKIPFEGDFPDDYIVVDFRSVYGVPFEYLTQLARDTKNRVRLLPPYKEHLSQAFARFFMRVGLPVAIG